MSNSTAKQEKKVYESPKLSVYGDLKKLTKTTTTQGITDNVARTSKTAID